jgi:hypothetical protein
MARPWRAGGDGRPVSIPELPWQRADEQVVVHTSSAEGGVDGKGRRYPRLPVSYYWSCTCGQSGRLHKQRKMCEISAHDHERRCDGERP